MYFNFLKSLAWEDQVGECYNRSVESWFHGNSTEMYSTHSKGESFITERFINSLKNKINKHMTAVSKKVYINKSDEIVEKYTTHHISYHRTTRMKLIDA